MHFNGLSWCLRCHMLSLALLGLFSKVICHTDYSTLNHKDLLHPCLLCLCESCKMTELALGDLLYSCVSQVLGWKGRHRARRNAGVPTVLQPHLLSTLVYFNCRYWNDLSFTQCSMGSPWRGPGPPDAPVAPHLGGPCQRPRKFTQIFCGGRLCFGGASRGVPCPGPLQRTHLNIFLDNYYFKIKHQRCSVQRFQHILQGLFSQQKIELVWKDLTITAILIWRLIPKFWSVNETSKLTTA